MAAPSPFAKKNVLVTGGAGFLGSFLCEALLKDCRVICIDNFITSSSANITHLLQDPNFEFIRADICQPITLDAYPELARFNMAVQGVQEVYHLACPTSVKQFDAFRMQTLLANSVGMRNVLDLAAKYKARVFHASTSVIYGTRPADGHAFREDELGSVNQLSPRACYDEGRRWAETMVSTYAELFGLDCRIGRIFRTYGPRMPLEDGQMIPDFIINATEGKDLTIYGGEEFRTSLVFVSDVIDGILMLMGAQENPGPVNIGSDHDLKLAEVARKIIEMTGSTSKVVFEQPLPFMRELGLPDITRAKSALGWLPLITLEQGLKKSIEFSLAHKDLLGSPFGQ